jgi:membrane associated rhomboid family serine protease
MMNETLVLTLVVANTIFTGIILWITVCAVDLMNKQTDHLVRAAYLVIGIASLAICLEPFFLPTTPSFGQVGLAFGVSALMLLDRRSRRRLLKPVSR